MKINKLSFMTGMFFIMTSIFPPLSYSQVKENFNIDKNGSMDYSSNSDFIKERNSEAFPSDPRDFSKERTYEFGTNQPYVEVSEIEAPKEEEVVEDIYKNYNLLPFPDSVIGIKDVEAASVVRSLAHGVAVQYIVFDNKVKESIIDTNTLTEEINEYIASAGKFFKKNPEYVGGFVTEFTLYPSFGEPFQYNIEELKNIESLDDNKIKFLSNRNDLLKKITNCHSTGYCAAFVIESLNYFSSVESPEKPFDIIDFEDHLILENRKSKQVFAYNKDFKEPVSIILFLGTNGYSISPKEVAFELEKYE